MAYLDVTVIQTDPFRSHFKWADPC